MQNSARSTELNNAALPTKDGITWDGTDLVDQNKRPMDPDVFATQASATSSIITWMGR
ncbi:hypothetical protein MPLSOD_140024 [Mesorhizobium sp. SOD10]|nr:hypothetical protein MPLSOD_140024 [Mesorhizobium sp. SOD10]